MIASADWYRLIDWVGRKRGVYARGFGSPDGKAVLKDLEKFCKAKETTYDLDPVKSAVNVGKREVWLYIQRYLNMSSDQLVRLLTQDGPDDEPTKG